jgi:hypothetical protein
MTMAQERHDHASGRHWNSWLADGFGWFSARRRQCLDIRDLSPHLLRDIGFLDGNDPRGPRP